MKSTMSFILGSGPQELLKPEEEIELGRIIQRGLRAKRINRYIELSKQDSSTFDKTTLKEWASLIEEFGKEPISDYEKPDAVAQRNKEIAAYQPAKDSLVMHNQKLVAFVAQRFSGYHIELAELTQEGLIGCMTAADKYNPDFGFKFSTFAVPWIRQQINRFIQNYNKPIRLPAHVVEALSLMKKLEERYKQEHNGDTPTDEQLAEMSEGKLSIKNIALYRSSSQPTASLNTIVGNEDDTELGDLIKDENDESPDEYAERHELHNTLEELISTLPDIEQKVVRLRFAFNPEHREYTLEEVGAKLGYTRERIRQFEESAKLTLRVRAKKLNLDGYIG